MPWVYAGWVVAGMHYVHPFRYLAECVLIGKPMSKLLADYRSKAKHAVALVVPVGLPLPALSVSLYGDFGPKTLIKHSLTMVGFPSEVKR